MQSGEESLLATTTEALLLC